MKKSSGGSGKNQNDVKRHAIRICEEGVLVIYNPGLLGHEVAELSALCFAADVRIFPAV